MSKFLDENMTRSKWTCSTSATDDTKGCRCERSGGGGACAGQSSGALPVALRSTAPYATHACSSPTHGLVGHRHEAVGAGHDESHLLEGRAAEAQLTHGDLKRLDGPRGRVLRAAWGRRSAAQQQHGTWVGGAPGQGRAAPSLGTSARAASPPSQCPPRAPQICGTRGSARCAACARAPPRPARPRRSRSGGGRPALATPR